MSKPLHDKIYDLKRESILEAASRMFEEHGYQMMKITDLAREVGISVGSIYAIFESKDQLYMAYIHRQIDLFMEYLRLSTPADATPQDQLLTFITLRFDIFIEKHKALDIVLMNNPVFDFMLQAGDENPLRKVYEHLASLIEPIQPLSPLRTPIEMAYLLEGICHGEVKLWMNHPNIDLAAKAEGIHRLFLTLVKENV